jgi:hypothetical protein
MANSDPYKPRLVWAKAITANSQRRLLLAFLVHRYDEDKKPVMMWNVRLFDLTTSAVKKEFIGYKDANAFKTFELLPPEATAPGAEPWPHALRWKRYKYPDDSFEAVTTKANVAGKGRQAAEISADTLYKRSTHLADVTPGQMW